MTVNVYGPRGSGKSTHAVALARHYQCAWVTDETDSDEPLTFIPPRTLLLSVHPLGIPGLVEVSIEDALRAIGVTSAGNCPKSSGGSEP